MLPQPLHASVALLGLVLLGCADHAMPAVAPPGPVAPVADRVDVAARTRIRMRVPPGLHGVRVAIGAEEACVLGAAGEVQCFGADGLLAPVPLPGPAVDLAMGRSHAVARLGDGSVYSWGSGQFIPGDGTSQYGRFGPTRASIRATSIDVGDTVTCASGEGGTRCWGHIVLPESDTGADAIWTEPTPIPVSHEPVLFASGTAFDIAVDHDRVRTWGYGGRRSLPMTGVESITASGELACASTASEVSCWGIIAASWTGAWEHPEEPQVIAGAPGGSELASNRLMLCGLHGDRVWCVGAGSLLDRRDGVWDVTRTPRAIAALDGAVQLAAGDSLVCAALRDGTIECLAVVVPEPEPPPS